MIEHKPLEKHSTKWYPVDIFTVPLDYEWTKYNDALHQAGILETRFAADMMRRACVNYEEAIVSAREGLKCQLFYYFDHEHAGEDIKYNDILQAINHWLGGDE